jgi:sulfite reductase (NADPH) flavoprotein alpha-component
MHLYYGARDPALDYYFEDDLQRWLAEQRLASLNTSFTHAAGRRLRRRPCSATRQGCASWSPRAPSCACAAARPWHGVAQALDAILATMGLSVQQLKAHGRYAEDTF